MPRLSSIVIALSGALILASAAFAAPRGAPEPSKPVDMERLYTGRWLEIARTPLRLTDGCPAGATEYTLRSERKVKVRDTCQVGQPGGRTRQIRGTGTILDPGTNAKLSVRYNYVIVWDYWILDRADDYSWFISSDPKLEKVWIYTREVPDAALLARLVRRVGELGYDVNKLEFPAQPPL